MNFGIISTANIANKVTKAIFQTGDSKVVAVSSRSIQKAKEFAEKNNIPKYYGSYEEILKDKEVQAVYIPLPTTLCKDWCIESAKAKKHIL